MRFVFAAKFKETGPLAARRRHLAAPFDFLPQDLPAPRRKTEPTGIVRAEISAEDSLWRNRKPIVKRGLSVMKLAQNHI